MNDIKLLELPDWTKRDDATQNMVPSELRSAMADYARINVEYHTERLRHEVETLRDGLDYLATMKGVKDVLDLRAKAARAKQLEEALRKARDCIDACVQDHYERSCGGVRFDLQRELDEIDAVLNKGGD